MRRLKMPAAFYIYCQPYTPQHAEKFARRNRETNLEGGLGALKRVGRGPRLGRSERTDVSPPRNGWIAVDDELSSRDPKLLRRLARELSDRTGAVVLALGVEDGAVVRYILFDRGAVADEYASVPEFHGPLPPGDVIALGANPTVAQRLTGADPGRVRSVARTAASPVDLPPPDQLLREIAAVLGVD